jgi:hypothetical protein
MACSGLAQGIPSEDDHPSCRGRLSSHHVKLQEIQRLIHESIRGLLQNVRKRHNGRGQRSDLEKSRLPDSSFYSQHARGILKTNNLDDD